MHKLQEMSMSKKQNLQKQSSSQFRSANGIYAYRHTYF